MTPVLFPELTSPWIFPAIDVRGGRCVRLIRGARDAEIRYDEDPVRVARRWEAAGATCLHVIDLGAAFGEGSSRRVLLDIAEAVRLPIQAGGGIRDEKILAELLDGGISRAILGTLAFREPARLARIVAKHGPERVLVSMDCDGDRVKVAGWEEDSPLGIEAGLKLVEEAGVNRLLVTATDRDGTLSGPRIDLFEKVLEGSWCRVVAAGGIGTLGHIESTLEIRHPRLEGVVVGRALYEGAVKLEDAVKLTARSNP